MQELVAVTVLMPPRLAASALEAAEAAGQRVGPETIRLEHFVIFSERAFERLLNGVQTSLCGGAETMPERAAIPAPAAASLI